MFNSRAFMFLDKPSDRRSSGAAGKIMISVNMKNFSP